MTAAPKYILTTDDGLRCALCPHGCTLEDGKTGICGVRSNSGGKAVLPFYGLLSAVSVDPIEKKPLYHFRPGSSILSIGFFGCNLRCPFCQNHTISQEFRATGKPKSPSEVVDMAAESGSFGIAYTYSEPLVHFEFVLETAKLARKKGLQNVLVSNGFLNPGPAAELLPFIDAANIDLKSFSDDFYRRTLGGALSPVLRFLDLASKTTHLEVTTLVIPGNNDTAGEIGGIARFIASLDPDIPFHMSCYFPRYKFSVRPTTHEDLAPLLAEARKHLRFVYPGNVREEANTHCPRCGELLVRRRGYAVEMRCGPDGTCKKCGEKIRIRMENSETS